MKELLKALQTKLSQLKGNYEVLKEEISSKQKQSSIMRSEIKSLEDKIKRFNTNKETIVSEHAILRYLERVKGFNIKEIEQEILSESVLKLIETLGPNGSYPNEGFSVKLKDNVVTTITV